MSGLETLGIVASVVQIADIGGRLSVKLCAFARKIKNADQNISSISNDVALTCTVLRELGDAFQKDKQTRLCSNNAITTAENVAAECKKVFADLECALDGDAGSGKGFLRRLGRGVKFSLVEPQIKLLRSNLERLKSTLLLMLNVIIYAGQLHRYKAYYFQTRRLLRLSSNGNASTLQKQRELITILKEGKKENDRKFPTHK